MTVKQTGSLQKKLNGSVLVIGSGIAGMQSALDLAEAGYFVHLVTESSSIGGKMTQLDKTFPTNECSMCLLGPKMTDTLNHPNIDIYTCSTLEKVEGQYGDFTVKIKKSPRYIDINECTACGDCAEVCPVEVLNEFNLGMDKRKAVYKLFPQAVPNKYLIEKKGTSPCTIACPAGTNVQGYVALISRGKFKEAVEVIRRRLPFIGICGRICHHPCENACNRSHYDDPVAIALLKRAAADYGWIDNHTDLAEKKTVTRQESVAVVGAGPAGLTAAYDLVKEGFSVTVYDKLPEPGGLMRAGIPRYRLPEEIVKKETDYLLKSGIVFKGNTEIGRDLGFEELKSKYDSVLLAVGLQEDRMLSIEGAEPGMIIPGVDFLRKISLGDKISPGKEVVVIGGGNVAVDAARTAKRLGADCVHILYRRGREEMPAYDDEAEGAVEEGVNFIFLAAPKKIKRDESGNYLECTEMKLGEPDASGRRRPIPTQKDFIIKFDRIISAVGQKLGNTDKFGVKALNGVIEADTVSLATSREGVFACGDAVHGARSVVEAVASGHEAAISIQRYLNGENLYEGRGNQNNLEQLGIPDNTTVVTRKRTSQIKVPVKDRITNFREVCSGFSKSEAVAEAERCLNCGICSECLQCVSACKKNAIHHEDREEMLDIKAGAIILAPGYELFDARLTGEYGYGLYENVITSMEMERLLSSTGPGQGRVLRPSDGKAPERIAFVQCVGSRDCARDGSEYCSSVCCMYSTKEALIAKEHDAKVEPTIFYLDMRSYGKNFDKYVDSAKVSGVRYLRTMVSAVKEDPVTKNLIIQYLENEKIVVEEFDLVVLAVGIRPPASAASFSKKLGIELNEYGFAKTLPFNPTASTQKGVFISGAFQGPRDIPETVMSASAAACSAGGLLSPARGTLQKIKTYPPEKDVCNEKPRVGVFICHCGINIASVVDVQEVARFAEKLPDVEHVEHNLYSCSQDALKKLRDTIIEKKLNRVVVASCTIRTHQSLFREALKEAGINQFYFEMANIRDQCSWVHRNEPREATLKAKDLVSMAVSKVRVHEPLYLQLVPVVHRALIIGGGIAGMIASLSLAEQGYESYIIERKKELGGYVKNLRSSIEGDDLQEFLLGMISEIKKNKKIKVFTNAELVDISGHQGHFITTVSTMKEASEDYRNEKLEHGVVIVATGVREYKPREYYYGEDERVITNTILEQQLADETWDHENNRQVVFLQCVGSRDAEHNYCSRICCMQSLKNALQIKRKHPNIEVYILYRDIRSYGFAEKYYKEAREKGVVFIRYEESKKPSVQLRKTGILEVEVDDHTSQTKVVLWPDQLVLATGVEAPAEVEKLANILKLPLNEDGFFVETHAKLGPMDFPTPGMFLCGGGHAPKTINEAILQAQGAVARACTILSRKNLMVGGVIAKVEEDKCAACLTCVRVCPYNVPRINERFVAEINSVQCQGCGICAAECPGKAIQLQHYTDKQVIEKVAGLFEGGPKNV